MRILFCNKYSFPFSGTEAYLFELIDLLRSHGHEVELFSMADPRARPWRYYRDFVPQLDFKSEAPFWRRAQLAAHAVYSSDARRRLRRVIEDFHPDIAHVRNIYHHLSPSILWELRAHHIPVLYHLNDFKVICPTYNLVAHGSACDRCRGGRFWHALTSRCYQGSAAATAVLTAEAYIQKWLGTYQRCVTRWLAPSRFVRDTLAANGWPEDRIDVLYHFQKLATSPPLSREHGPILYFGRLSAEKGLLDLLRAMQRLPRVRLQIAGDGPQKSELAAVARELGICNVEFVGHLEGKELDELIGACAFTVFPTHAYETLGKSILESYAHSRPVIATDLGSRRELVIEEKTGLLYRPGDWQQLAQEIEFLHFQPGLVYRMGLAGRELVRTRHSPESHYESLLSIYEGLAASSRSRVSGPSAAPKLRIAFIGGRGVISKYSGIETYYEEVGSRLAEKGHQVTAYCRTYFTPANETHKGIHIVRLPTIRTKHLDTLVHTALSTLHAMAHSYDIVHYHTLGPSLFSFLPHLTGKKTAVTVQGLDWQRKKWGRFASALLRLGEYSAIQYPDSTMVVSRTLQAHFRERFGATPVFIPNGTHLRARASIERLRIWGLESGNYILYLGRFSPEKNCHLLIEAYRRLGTDTKLVLAGGSSYSDPYVAELRKLESDRIRLLDWVSGDALDELLTHAMIFVLPSDLEGLSLALLDAMAAGVCVVTSDVAENREVVEGAGFTFRRGDAADLARVLQALIADQDLRKQAAQAARERACELYLWPRIVDQIEAEYLRVLGWPRPECEVEVSRQTAGSGGSRAA